MLSQKSAVKIISPQYRIEVTTNKINTTDDKYSTIS